MQSNLLRELNWVKKHGAKFHQKTSVKDNIVSVADPENKWAWNEVKMSVKTGIEPMF